MKKLTSDILGVFQSAPSWLSGSPYFSGQGQKMISSAMTLVELMLVVAIAGTLAAIGIPAYNSYIDKVRNEQALEDIRFIEAALKVYHTDKESFPETLEEAKLAGRLDPWNNPYRYCNLEGKTLLVIKKEKCCRHLGNEIPLNNDFDLYSIGKDGESKRNLPARQSRDDIVRIHDGAYVGLASEY